VEPNEAMRRKPQENAIKLVCPNTLVRNKLERSSLSRTIKFIANKTGKARVKPDDLEKNCPTFLKVPKTTPNNAKIQTMF
jgi:hypothetical protein